MEKLVFEKIERSGETQRLRIYEEDLKRILSIADATGLTGALVLARILDYVTPNIIISNIRKESK